MLLADDFVLEIFENNYKSSSLFNKRVVVNTNVDMYWLDIGIGIVVTQISS